MSLHESLFTVKSVHDGDTMEGDLDLGYYFSLSNVSLRIYGINAPELTKMVSGHRVLQQDGEDSTQHLMTLLGGRSLFAATRTKSVFGVPGNYEVAQPGAIQMVVRTRINTGDDYWEKYGRILGQCFLGASDNPYGLNIGAQMILDGYAVPDVAAPGDAPA